MFFSLLPPLSGRNEMGHTYFARTGKGMPLGVDKYPPKEASTDIKI